MTPYKIKTMAVSVGVGLSTAKDSIQAAEQALRQAKINFRAETINLALVFSSVGFAHPTTLKTISNSLGTVDIIGCSGGAIISNQGIFKNAILVVLLGLSAGVYYNAAYVKDIKTKGALSAGGELGEKLLSGFPSGRRNLSVIFSDGLLEESSNLIHGLEEKLGRSFPVVGASASSSSRSARTYVYYKNETVSDACCGILWGGKLNFGLGIKHGWRPLGKPRIVTVSRGNIVYEIDGAPAAKVYEEYFYCGLANLKKELRRISVFYPIGIYLPGEKDYLLRNILSIEDDGSLIFQGDVPERSQIRLMIGTKESCLAATRQALDEAIKGLSASIIEPIKKETIDFVLIFDSISRYMLLGREASKELQLIKDGLGRDVPVIGLYTYGEQAPLRAIDYRGRTYLHNQTISILAFGG